MKKNFYAVTLWDGRYTTTGTANEKTGRFSIACNMHVFSSKKDRDNFVEKSSGFKTSAVTRKELRTYFLGISVEGFEAEIEWAKRENVLNALMANKESGNG